MKPTGKHVDLLDRAVSVVLAIKNKIDGYGPVEWDDAEITNLACDIMEYLEGYNPQENN